MNSVRKGLVWFLSAALVIFLLVLPRFVLDLSGFGWVATRLYETVVGVYLANRLARWLLEGER